MMAQHQYGHYGGGQGGSIDPNELAMAGNAGFGYGNNPNGGSKNYLQDDELLDGLAMSPTEPGQGPEYGMNEMGIGGFQGMYGSHHGVPMDQQHINGYSNTPDGDPIQSPFVHNFSQAQFRQMQQHPQQQGFGTSLQSPISYSGSPLAGPEMGDGDAAFLNAKSRARLAAQMQRKTSTTRSPLTPKAGMQALSLGSQESGFGPQPIRTAGPHHDKAAVSQWANTPASLQSFPASGFSSPIHQTLHSTQQISELLMKGGASMPAKLGSAAVSTQEAKRKRRRESHNLVERRRRDNINERIQDLSRLVPAHRLEDEKIRKLIQNGTPLSPSLTGINTPNQATSGLAGPGARRATSGGAGSITTGLPIEDKDKGPNKGDILNGAVSWTRDLMWMLHLKLQQQEELINTITELGGTPPFELTEDEKRMQTELLEALAKQPDVHFSYSRTNGSGLRVPHHTDYRGEPLPGTGVAPVESGGPSHVSSVSPNGGARGTGAGADDDGTADLLNDDQYWNDDDDDADVKFREEDEYMDLGQ